MHIIYIYIYIYTSLSLYVYIYIYICVGPPASGCGGLAGLSERPQGPLNNNITSINDNNKRYLF